MTGAGRPLRFLAMTLGSWTAIRVAVLWPTIDSLPSLIRVLAPPVAAATRPPGAIAAVPPTRPPPAYRPTPTDRPPPRATVAAKNQDLSHTAPTSRAAPPPSPPDPPRQPPPLRPAPLAVPPDRWAASAWLIARGGRADALAGGQLGASQAGVRVTYALGRRIAIAARLSAPFEGRGAEGAIGVDWQPTRAPVHLVAERRVALDGGRGGTAVLVIGGLDPTRVALGFTIDAYGQAGGIRRGDGVIGFADGAMRLARPVARIGGARLEFGAGAWGGIQPGAARIDVGPSAAVILPLGGRAARISLDWRQRVAGHARPGSGPAVSIGSDF